MNPNFIKKVLFCILFVSFIYSGFSQKPKIVTVTGEADIELTEDKSRMQVKDEAEKFATIDALERAFGTVIIQGNSTYISNKNTGEKIESSSGFNMIADTYVKGEVVEVLNKNFKDIEGTKTTVDGKTVKFVHIKCTIKIKAKEKKEKAVVFTASPLSCNNLKCQTTTFKDGNDFFMYFSSPESGYVTIYLDDKITAQRMLPYINMPPVYENGIPVKADKQYIFFSKDPEHDYFHGEDVTVEKLELFAESNQDLNRIFVIFSKSSLSKPKLKEKLNEKVLTEMDKEEGYKMPKSIESEEFQHWLIKNQQIREDLQIMPIDITIDKF
ncbi:MAG: hypothetical protein KAT68_13190 [Bacteroidales bacterium]|nr:hypothetical protein [Bacteroidales bacterium]